MCDGLFTCLCCPCLRALGGAHCRWTWTHGTRLGAEGQGLPGLHDWWGVPEAAVQRQPERHSIVLAFGRP